MPKQKRSLAQMLLEIPEGDPLDFRSDPEMAEWMDMESVGKEITDSKGLIKKQEKPVPVEDMNPVEAMKKFMVEQREKEVGNDVELKGDEVSELVIYQGDGGAVDVRLEGETVWLRHEQIAALFGRDRTVIGRHIRNVFEEGELARSSVCAKFAHTAGDGKTYQVEHFNLDVIISVGYRVKSVEGTRFRQWATQLVREHLTRGYTINRQRLEANARELESALTLVRRLAAQPDLGADAGRGLADIVSRYAQTFLLLQRYDEGLLAEPPVQSGGVLPSVDEARASLLTLKTRLVERGEAADLFARERDSGLESLLGNLDQSVFGEPAYPSVESKAAHLLYFVIKNHPFADGNKRSGAFLFVDFLHRNRRLFNSEGQPVINDIGLAALALLVAESDPTQKGTMIRLIMNMLATQS